MYCPNCGKQQPDESKFCNNCGTALQQQAAQSTPPADVPYAAPVQSPPPQPQPVPQSVQAPIQQPAQPKTKKPWYKKWWIWVILGVASTLIISAIGITMDTSPKSKANPNFSVTGSKSNNDSKPLATTSPSSQEEKTEAPEPPTEDPETVKKEFIDSCETIDYKPLARNPDNYKGKHLKYTGQVIQVLESKSVFNKSTTLRVNVTAEDNQFAEGGKLWKDTIICAVTIPEGGDRILEKDVIDLYGVCEGLYTYETVLGNNESVPRIDIEYYEIHQ